MIDWLRQPASESSMDLERAALKADLYHQRRQWRLYRGRLGFIAQCDLCGLPFAPWKTMPDLHEVLVDRGDAMRASAETRTIVLHSAVNLQLLCNDPCNIKLADDDLLKTHLIGRQIERYGLAVINDWLRTLDLLLINSYLARAQVALCDSHASDPHLPPSYDDIQPRAEFLDQVRVRLREYGRLPLF